MANWQKRRLSDLFRIGSSKRVLKSQWCSEGVPFFRGREVTRRAVDGYVENELFVSEEHYAELAREYGVPGAGDLMITAIGTIGNAFVVTQEDRFYFKDASVLWLQKKSDVNSDFINYWLKSTEFLDQLDRGNGATVDTLTIQKLQSVVINLPELAEQHRIVAILDEALDAIATAKANTEKNLRSARKVFDRRLLTILQDEKWMWTTLGHLCNAVEYGSSAKSKAKNGMPVLRMGNIQDGQLSWDSLVYTDNEDEIAKYSLKHNDVLFNRTNSPELVGKTAVYKGERPAIFAGYLIRIHRKEDQLDADFLTYFLNSQFAFDYGKTVVISSVNQANINGTKLKSYPIPAIPLADQRSIASELSDLGCKTRQLIQIYQRKLTAQDELKKSLLHQAFTGKLTAKTTDKQLEAVV